MRTIEINIPDNCSISNIGFATTLVSKACEYTSDEIQIKTNDNSFVDLKSIMGVLTLNYHNAKTIVLQILGENENYTAPSLERFISKEIEKYM